MTVNLKSQKRGSILALDCSSSKSGVTIINELGQIAKTIQIHLVYRSIKKVKIPHIEIKDYTNNPEGELVEKINLSQEYGFKLSFAQKAVILSNYLMGIIKEYDIKYLFIEDYAYYSTGKTVDIIEMTSIMKYLVAQESSLEWVRVAPTSLKSYNCGAANASKDDMRAALEVKTGIYYESFDVVDSTVLAMLASELLPHLKEVVEEGVLRSSYKKFIRK